MLCRSFLSPWYDEDGNAKFYSRFNLGVVTINLPDAALSAKGDIKKFWKILDERLALCREACMMRHDKLVGVTSDVSPIHYQYGAIARLKPGEKIDKLLENGYATVSLGYIGLAEATYALIGESNTSKKGSELSMKIIKKLRESCDTWKKETGLGFGLYGTPAESTTYTFAKKLRNRFGIVPNVTDKMYLSNSYHCKVTESIDAYSKIAFEEPYQDISSGGAISYIEVPNMENNLEALSDVVDFMYDHLQYGEINTVQSYCHECGERGKLTLRRNEKTNQLEWYCPCCGNTNLKKMNVAARTCGYVGDNWWNPGKTEEINERVKHLGHC